MKKKVFLIGGPMGSGKTTVSQYLKGELEQCAFLDGDWCWDMDPFQVTEETKKMVLENICFLLNNFIHCSAYKNIVFCWVLHQQETIDKLIEGLDQSDCEVIAISLMLDEDALVQRLQRDIDSGQREEEIIERSCSYLSLYDRLETVKVDVTTLSPEETALKIIAAGRKNDVH